MEKYVGKHSANKIDGNNEKIYHTISGKQIKTQISKKINLDKNGIIALLAALIVAGGSISSELIKNYESEKQETEIITELSNNVLDLNELEQYKLVSKNSKLTTKGIIYSIVLEHLAKCETVEEQIDFINNLNQNAEIVEEINRKLNDYGNIKIEYFDEISYDEFNPNNVDNIVNQISEFNDKYSQMYGIDPKIAIGILSVLTENGSKINFNDVYGDWIDGKSTRTYYDIKSGKLIQIPNKMADSIECQIEQLYKYLSCSAKAMTSNSMNNSDIESIIYSYFDGRIYENEGLSPSEQKELCQKQTNLAIQYIMVYVNDRKFDYQIQRVSGNKIQSEYQIDVKTGECLSSDYNEYANQMYNEMKKTLIKAIQEYYPTYLEYRIKEQ